MAASDRDTECGDVGLADKLPEVPEGTGKADHNHLLSVTTPRPNGNSNGSSRSLSATVRRSCAQCSQ